CALPIFEAGVLLIPPYEPLDAETEAYRGFAAVIVAVSSLDWHNDRFQAWLRASILPHAAREASVYPMAVPLPRPDRPDLDDGRALFEHVPDGATFRHEGVTYVKIRPGAYRDANAVVVENDEAQVVIDPGDCAVFETAVEVTFDHNDPTMGRLEAIRDE